MKSIDKYGYSSRRSLEYEKNHDYKYHNVHEPDRKIQFDFASDNR